MAITKTKTIAQRQVDSIEAGASKVRVCINLSQEELYWAMIDLGTEYAESQYPHLKDKLMASPFFWAEFKLWWHANNNRFLSEITADDLEFNGQEWAKAQYMEAQLIWCQKFYRLSTVVLESLDK